MLETAGLAKVTQACLEKVEQESTKETHNEIPFFLVHEAPVKEKKMQFVLSVHRTTLWFVPPAAADARSG